MERRAFVTGIAGSLLAAPLAAAAQQTTRIPRIGLLSGQYVGRQESPGFKAFTEGLRESGYVVGQNVLVDVRTPGDKVEQYPDLAARLVTEGVDVILAGNNDLFRRAADYVAAILKGTKPGELPVQRPSKFDLVINLKNAKALGLTIPASLLQRRDHVIE